VAEDRSIGMGMGSKPLLFEVMDGLDGDADVTFLLTTNRAADLERALTQRPGRVDLAAEIPLPDEPARTRLITLYAGGLFSERALADVAARSEGTTASFAKELVRRSVLRAAIAGVDPTDEHLTRGTRGPALRRRDAHPEPARCGRTSRPRRGGGRADPIALPPARGLAGWAGRLTRTRSTRFRSMTIAGQPCTAIGYCGCPLMRCIALEYAGKGAGDSVDGEMPRTTSPHTTLPRTRLSRSSTPGLAWCWPDVKGRSTCSGRPVQADICW